jgi:hypothetical protein
MNRRTSLRHKFEHSLARFARRTFGFWERLGLHVTPVHYYEPIPDTRTLSEDLWERRSEMIGVDFRESQQLDLIEKFEAAYRDEYTALPQDGDPNDVTGFFLSNGNFGSVDAEILYCLIRDSKPQRILEIGSGYSTLLSSCALTVNRTTDGAMGKLTAVEPFPPEFLDGNVDLVERPVERVPLSVFQELGPGDILFIDSSHVVRTGGDVQYELLEILPRLSPGVLIHVHDIFLPREYPRDWVIDGHRFWTEQYLLHALLTFSVGFDVVWAAGFMHERHPGLLQKAFPSYDPRSDRPGSFWLRRRRLETADAPD